MRPSTEFTNTLAAPLASEIDELTERSESLEQRISSLNESYEMLKKREVELIEWRWVLREAGSFFDRVGGSEKSLNLGYCADSRRHRLMGMLKRSAIPSTTPTRHLSCETLSSRTRAAKTVMRSSRSRFPCWTLDSLLESSPEIGSEPSSEFCGVRCAETST